MFTNNVRGALSKSLRPYLLQSIDFNASVIAQLPASKVNGTLLANLKISDFLCSFTILPASPPYAIPASTMNATPPL